MELDNLKQSRATLGRAAFDQIDEADCGDATRRALIGAAFAAPLALAASRAAWDVLTGTEAKAQSRPNTQKDGPHKLPPLPYGYGALNEAIDARTMRLHHDKHHKTYVDNLNLAVVRLPQAMRNDTPQNLIMNLSRVPQEVRDQVRNNGGGHVNHSMFWSIMSPRGGGAPRGEIARAINAGFGSFDRFKSAFNAAGLKRFGSGWVWLAADKNGAMKIITTPNQDNPLMMGMFPVMGNDVWEHAYYLRYQNRRAEYLKAWWNVVNWDAINARLRFMQSSWMRG